MPKNQTTKALAFILAATVVTTASYYLASNQENFSANIIGRSSSQIQNIESVLDENNNTTITWSDISSAYFENPNCQSPITLQSLSEYTTNQNPDIALNKKGNFSITWQATKTDNSSDIFVQEFSSDCTALSAATQVNTTPGQSENPAIDINPETNNFVISWENSGNILARQGTENLNFTNPSDLIIAAKSEFTNSHPDIAINNSDQFIITWEGNSTEDPAGIYIQSFTATNPLSAGKKQLINSLTEGTQTNPKIKAIKNQSSFIITWEGPDSSNQNNVYFKRISRCTNDECLINSIESKVSKTENTPQSQHQLAVDARGNFSISWLNSSNQIKIQNFNNNQKRAGEELQFSPNRLPQDISLAMNNQGDYSISWAENKEIKSEFSHSNFYKLSSEFQANSFTENTQENTSISSSSDGYRTVIAWEGDGGSYLDSDGIYFSLYDNSGKIINDKQGILANKYTRGPQSRPATAMFNNGDFIICWDGEGPKDKQGIFLQKFNNDGTPNGALQRVNTTTQGPQFFCDIAANPNQVGNFIITWDGKTETDNQGIAATAFNSYSPSKEIPINSETTGFQGYSKVAISENNQAVITWLQELPETTSDIFGQQINLQATKSGSNFLVNNNQTVPNKNQSIDFGTDNEFFITWEEQNQIKVRHYEYENSANPTSLTEEITVSDTTNSNSTVSNTSPDIQVDKENNAIITWTSNEDILYQIISFNLINKIQGPPLKANTTRQGSQHNSQITALEDLGQFIITWSGQGSEDPQGIQAQKFTNTSSSASATLTAQSEQEVIAGGRTLIVPEIAELQPIKASLDPQTNFVIFKNNDPAIPPYIEVRDLLADQNPYNINITADDMSREEDDLIYIQAKSFSVKNSSPGYLTTLTIRGESQELTLDPSTNQFTSLEETQVLATSPGTKFGIWRFLPEIKLEIPAMTPPGKHTGALIFSLN